MPPVTCCQQNLFKTMGCLVFQIFQSTVQPEVSGPPGSGSWLIEHTTVSKFFFLLRTLQLIDWIFLGANSSEMHNKVGRYRWGYHYNLFPAYTGWTQDHLSIGRHPNKDLKWIELCLGPIQRRLEAFLGFLVKTQIKAYKKLTVVMCCQIVARKSVAPSSGDFRRQSAPR